MVAEFNEPYKPTSYCVLFNVLLALYFQLPRVMIDSHITILISLIYFNFVRYWKEIDTTTL